ncbi:MAG: GGDEF domain-containing protein [Actinobacteria bacterium]|nr:GGDEF domain-containing protein [Actinomycetota bacterium]
MLEIDLREKTDRLEKLLVTDDLTGLFNKRYFFEKIEEEMKRSKRSGNSFCLLFFDIDNFKTINDLRGHLIGDKILKTIGEIVNNNIRKYLDYGFRYGGDEFLIILSDADQSQAITVAERIRILVKKISFEKVSISLGLVESRKDYLPKTLINYADIAMYKAKSDGGDTISVYVD